MNSEGKCRHQWVIEFSQMPDSAEKFMEVLDSQLQQLNSDYEAKRYKDITLQKPELVIAPQGTFNPWLKSRGKRGGQHKVPRLANDRKVIEEVLKFVKRS